MESHCQIGLTCSNKKCIEKYSLEVGKETDEKNACKTGKIQGNKCATYTVVDGTCTIRNNGGIQKMYCKTRTNDGTTDSTNDSDSCLQNWDDKYICPTEKYSKWDKYVEEFKKRYDDLSDDDKKDKYINRNTLNKNKVRDAYTEYEYYANINFDDNCIKDFYQRSDNSHHLTLSLFLIFFFVFSLN